MKQPSSVSGTGDQETVGGDADIDLISRLVVAMRRWGVLFAVIAVAPALALWPLLHLDEIRFIVTGQLGADLRVQIVKAMALSAAIIGGFYLTAHFMVNRRVPGTTLAESFERLNHYTFVLIALPLITGSMVPGIEVEHEFICLGLIAAVSGMVAVFLYRVLPVRPAVISPAGTKGPIIATILLFLFYGVYVSHLALLDHRNLGTHIYDLGIYDNVVWRTAYADFLGCTYCKGEKHWSAHFDPVLWPISWVYRGFPRAETLLVFQSMWVASGVFPIFFIARRKFQSGWLAVLLAVVYVFYPATHGVNLFDFHTLTLSVPVILWLVYWIDYGSAKVYWPTLALLLAIREDMSILACFVGLYALVRGRAGLGISTAVLAMAYLAFVKLNVMNDTGLIMSGSNNTESYHYFFKEMIPHPDEGVRGLVITAITDPIYALQILLKEEKVFFFVVLLLPLGFLPLLGGSKRLLFLYGLVFLGLASRKHVFSLHFQYSSVLFPFLFAATPEGVESASRSRLARAYGLEPQRLRRAVMGMLVAATMLTSVKFGAFVPNQSFKAGWNRLARGPNKRFEDRYKAVRKLVSMIPPEASVSSTNGLGPHVSNREVAHKWPRYRDADFLLLTNDLNRRDKRQLDRLVKAGKYKLVVERSGVELYERIGTKVPTSNNGGKGGALDDEIDEERDPMREGADPDEADDGDDEDTRGEAEEGERKAPPGRPGQRSIPKGKRPLGEAHGETGS